MYTLITIVTGYFQMILWCYLIFPKVSYINSLTAGTVKVTIMESKPRVLCLIFTMFFDSQYPPTQFQLQPFPLTHFLGILNCSINS